MSRPKGSFEMEMQKTGILTKIQKKKIHHKKKLLLHLLRVKSTLFSPQEKVSDKIFKTECAAKAT